MATIIVIRVEEEGLFGAQYRAKKSGCGSRARAKVVRILAHAGLRVSVVELSEAAAVRVVAASKKAAGRFVLLPTSISSEEIAS